MHYISMTGRLLRKFKSMTKTKLILCIAIFYASSPIFGQQEEKGPFVALGLGVGFSTFEDHYFETRPGAGGFSITEFSGFKAVMLNVKIGYKITDNIGIYAKNVFIPGTATISPIRSNWLGGNISFDIPTSDRYYMFIGAGRSTSAVSQRGIEINQSVLYNAGVGIKMNNTIIEFEIFAGAVDESSQLDPNPFAGVKHEVFPSLSFSYLFNFISN